MLETLYHHFDLIAKRRGVWKVETIGDSYVAVAGKNVCGSRVLVLLRKQLAHFSSSAGLPEPRKDHAVVMCKFARDCLAKMHLLIKDLEAELGPDTCKLDEWREFEGVHSLSTKAAHL